MHLQTAQEEHLLFDIVLMVSFIFNGLVLGYISVYVVHIELVKRLVRREAHALIAAALLACGFAAYLGRHLRWNTWDVLLHPGGVVFDVTDRFINPSQYPGTFLATSTFFVLLGMMYVVMWFLVQAIQEGSSQASRL